MNLSAEQQRVLDRAVDFHGKGDLDQAAALYLDVLSDCQEQPDALHYLGVIELQRGRFDAAVELIEKAVAIRPDFVDAISNLGYGLNALGQYEAAATQFERALSIGPGTAELFTNLGDSLGRLGRYDDAVLRFEAALRLQPRLAETRRNLADALLSLGRTEDALREITRAVANGQPSLAMQVSHGNILLAAGRGDDAIRKYEQVLQAQAAAPGVRENLAKALRDTGRSAAAAEQYERLIAENPENVDAYQRLGVTYQDLGQNGKALAAFRRATALDVTCAEAWHGISSVCKNAFADHEETILLDLQEDGRISVERRILLAFALGKHYENTGRHNQAATQYVIANGRTRAELDYDIDDDFRTFRFLRDRFDDEFLRRWDGAGSPNKTPIFIVGMHRSGSTLVEQILASHSEVFAAGEIALLTQSIARVFPATRGNHFTRFIDDASSGKCQEVANLYLNALPKTDTERVTDKLPHNFLNIGIIRLVFPNATIVHCRRDPRDTCFSIFKNMFGRDAYQFDLQELAKYYNAYTTLMSHWENVMPGVIHTVNYERLVDDQEQTTRKLLDACGLEWEPACLEFHTTHRPIPTISASQVRQPVYRSSVGAWKPYEEMLRPLLDVLERSDDTG